MAALQTLAIVAYKLPVSVPEIHAIRRVEAPGVLRTLLNASSSPPPASRTTRGHARLYKTTRQFPIDFGLKDGSELPALEEFAELRERYERNFS